MTKILVASNSGVEHLATKVQHIKVVSTQYKRGRSEYMEVQSGGGGVSLYGYSYSLFYQPRSHFPAKDLSSQSDEYVLDLLDTTDQKLHKLLEELDGQNIGEILRQMEEEEVS